MTDTALQVYVINMASRPDRMAFVTRQLAALGLNFERVEAVTPADIPAERYEALAHLSRRQMSPSELSCTLSHLACWEQIAAGTSTALVIEDDAILSPELTEAITAYLATGERRAVNFESSAETKYLGDTVATADKWTFPVILDDCGGSACTLLFPEHARRLADNVEAGCDLADSYLFCQLQGDRLQCCPGEAIQPHWIATYWPELAVELDSDIERPKSANKAFSRADLRFPRMFLRRLGGEISRGRRRKAAPNPPAPVPPNARIAEMAHSYLAEFPQ